MNDSAGLPRWILVVVLGLLLLAAVSALYTGVLDFLLAWVVELFA